MQFILPRVILILLSLAVAVFCYFESVYYHDSLTALSVRSADIRLWMWVFRVVAGLTAILGLMLTVDLVRKLT